MLRITHVIMITSEIRSAQIFMACTVSTYFEHPTYKKDNAQTSWRTPRKIRCVHTVLDKNLVLPQSRQHIRPHPFPRPLLEGSVPHLALRHNLSEIFLFCR